MALNPHFSVAARNNMLDEITAEIGTTAQLLIYAGTQPADVSSAVTAANVVIASLAFPSTNAFGVAAAGVMTANSITSDTSAVGGTAVWFSFTKNTGARVMDGSVGISSGAFDLVFPSTTIATGSTVNVTAFTITLAA